MARFIRYQAGGRDAILDMSKESFDGIEQIIRWAETETPLALRDAMDSLCWHMAVVNQGYAREMSFGVYDPQERNSGAAWRVPVRRITNKYYLSWKVRRRGPAHYELYNDSREAYFIEFGINPRGAGRRVRRPVRKMSLRRTMEFMMTTQAYHRVWCDIFSSPRHRHRGLGFSQIVQSPGLGGMGHMLLGRRLPG